jgi:hypothetical protein
MELLKDLGMHYPTETSKLKRRYGLYKCPYCNIVFKAQTMNIKNNTTKSCGCLRRDTMSIIGSVSRGTHNMCKTPIHNSWTNLKTRCTNENTEHYKDYGGRGITYCERWEIFDNFLLDMGSTWKPGLSIDRINNDGNYEPSNCKWSTPLEQLSNRRPYKKGARHDISI